jgi:predicted nucleic acid-binding protein
MESGKRWLCVAVCVLLLHGAVSDQAAEDRAELERAFVMLMDSQWVSDPRAAVWHAA